MIKICIQQLVNFHKHKNNIIEYHWMIWYKKLELGIITQSKNKSGVVYRLSEMDKDIFVIGLSFINENKNIKYIAI